MARLHEYQGKALLAQKGIPIPPGRAASTPDEAREIATEIGGLVVVKMQAWVTGRAGLGGIRFAETPDGSVFFAVGTGIWRMDQAGNFTHHPASHGDGG